MKLTLWARLRTRRPSHDTTTLETSYFAIPRRTTGEEPAAELGISDQAVSERLRRAQTAVFSALLLGDEK